MGVKLIHKNGSVELGTPSIVIGSGGSVDLSGYYTKEEVDTQIDVAIDSIEIPDVDLSGYYTKTEVDALIPEIPEVDLSGYYTKTQIDEMFENVGAVDLPASEEGEF